MTDKKTKLQKLRIPTGWSIGINNLYEVDPVSEYIDYYYGSVLISGDNRLMRLSFDSRYEPEGQPGGDFILVLQRSDYDKKGKLTGVEVIDIKKTKDKKLFVEMLERFMEQGVV
ncbi:hypothetical protein [Kosakonia sp. SOY2]|uniref:hypothetical protein n=1 Tax=Kosakonia sp. SOY2 TaxID=3014557 RepID=UPI0022ABE642|nr:hypothetical protein [Kosakonia sp. SOY2]MCZ3384156.1 hypothetical protein [Kosakonia sp. SOY2]